MLLLCSVPVSITTQSSLSLSSPLAPITPSHIEPSPALPAPQLSIPNGSRTRSKWKTSVGGKWQDSLVPLEMVVPISCGVCGNRRCSSFSCGTEVFENGHGAFKFPAVSGSYNRSWWFVDAMPSASMTSPSLSSSSSEIDGILRPQDWQFLCRLSHHPLLLSQHYSLRTSVGAIHHHFPLLERLWGVHVHNSRLPTGLHLYSYCTICRS